MSGDYKVSIALSAKVADYVRGMTAAAAATKRLGEAQRATAESGRSLAASLTEAGVAARGDAEGMRAAASATRSLERAERRLGETRRSIPAGPGGSITSTGSAGSRGGGGSGNRRGALIGVAAVAGAGAAIKILPAALTAASAGAGVLGSALGSAAISAGVLKASTLGLGKAFKLVDKDADPFTKLAPNAQRLVAVYAQLKPRLDAFQKGLQQRATAQAAGDLNILATVSLPKVAKSAQALAVDYANVFHQITLSTTDPAVSGAFNTLAGSADHFFDQITTRIRPAVSALATLATSADPVARAFGDRLVGVVDHFTAAVAKAKASGRLDDFFAGAAKSAEGLTRIVADLLSMFGQVVSAAQKQQASFSRIADGLDHYVASGESLKTISGVVDTLTAAFDGLAQVAGPLGGILRDALADPGTTQALKLMFQVLAAGSQALKSVFTIFQALPDGLQGVVLAAVALAIVTKRVVGGFEALTASASRAAASLAKVGAEGTLANRSMTGLGRGVQGAARFAGRAAGVLAGLAIVGSIADQFHQAANATAEFTGALQRIGSTGGGGQAIKALYGEGLGKVAEDVDRLRRAGGLAGLGKAVGFEQALPGVSSFFNALDASQTNLQARLTGLDETFAQLARAQGPKAAEKAFADFATQAHLTGDQTAVLRAGLPAFNAALEQTGAAADTSAAGFATATEHAALLKAGLDQVVFAGRSVLDVFNLLNGGAINVAQSEIAANVAAKDLAASLRKNGLGLNRRGDDFNLRSTKGQDNAQKLIAEAQAAATNADAVQKQTGSVEKAAQSYEEYVNQIRAALLVEGASPATVQALIDKYAAMPAVFKDAGVAAGSLNSEIKSIPKGTKFVFDGTKTLIDAQGQTLNLKTALKGIPAGKVFTFNGHSLVDAQGKVISLKNALDQIPKNPKITPQVDTVPSDASINAIEHRLEALDGKTVTSYVRVAPKGFVGPVASEVTPRQVKPNLHGSTMTAMAAGGVASIYPASNPPLVKFAEPETGGEGYIPKNGSRTRNLAIMSEIARWPSVNARVVPMAGGGVTAAASGLVTVAPNNASRLDNAVAYLQTRDAITSLNEALKKNGHAFSTATAKGRENQGQVFSAIKAAQDAAKTKFDETGNVRLANAAYDAYILRLRQTLVQQKVNRAAIRGLLSFADRPTFAASDSHLNIAAAKSQIGAQGALADLRDSLSLNRPTLATMSKEGRDNLSSILGFIEAAGSAAQDQYAQTGSAKTASALYGSLIAELRSALKANGYSATVIAGLVSRFGRISLVPNAQGGVYGPGDTLYQFREPSTGGEAFLPRRGDRARGERILQIGAGWYGGQYTPRGGSGVGGASYAQHMTVNNYGEAMTVAKHQQVQRQADVRTRVNRPR